MTRSRIHLLPPLPGPLLAPLLAAALVAVTTLGGCVTRPRHDEEGMLPSARTLIAMELGTRASGPRLRHLAETPARLQPELARIARLPGATAAVSSELRRPRGLAARASDLALEDLRRRPSFDIGVLPTGREFAQNTADDLDHALLLLGMGPRPLGEIDDREHRTDHRDQGPERSLWHRLMRRLPF